jgi:superfamily II DNA or RNA helicase
MNTKKGYLLERNDTNEKIVRNELIVTPFVKHTFNTHVESYQLFRYNYDKIQVPKFWAFNKFNDFSLIERTHKLIDVAFNGTLRDYQEDIINRCLPIFETKGGGVISLPCGDGKTCVAINLFTRLRAKTLVIVHKTFLMNQWIESISKFTDAKIGVIQGKKIDIEDKDIVIGMLQSLSMKDYPETLWNNFDFMIVDEVHNIATKVFSKALCKINTRYTLGLSATPEREDKLSKVFYWYLGDMMFQKGKNKNSTVKVKVINYVPSNTCTKQDLNRFKECKTMKGDINMAQMITNLSKISERNNKIISEIKSILEIEPNRNVLVLSSRIEQLETLKSLFNDDEVTTLYIGKMKKKELDEAQSKQIFFATYEMVNEGFDLPKLDTLIFATPRSKVEQSVGRILRNKENSPIIIDIIDKLSIFFGQGYKRKKFYKDLNYDITEVKVSLPTT